MAPRITALQMEHCGRREEQLWQTTSWPQGMSTTAHRHAPPRRVHANTAQAIFICRAMLILRLCVRDVLCMRAGARVRASLPAVHIVPPQLLRMCHEVGVRVDQLLALPLLSHRETLEQLLS